ncbi:MAG: cell division protein FtsQ/DivIB [Pyrinomonadaceae bacterium]
MGARVRRKPVSDPTPRTASKRKKARGRSAEIAAGRFGNFVLPLVLSVCLVICLAVLGYLGLQSVTASKFFDVRSVSVSGTERASKTDIERIAASMSEKTGVWNADLSEIRARVEKLPFVKTATVARALPDGLRVAVVERVPIAVVTLANGPMLVDNEGMLLAPPNEREEGLPVILKGWDEGKSEKAFKDNLERVKIYQKMIGEWKELGLVERVNAVDLGDLRSPRAMTQDSGFPVTIEVGRESFGQHLKNGISAIAGKGDQFDGVNLVGSNMILNSRKTAARSAPDQN